MKLLIVGLFATVFLALDVNCASILVAVQDSTDVNNIISTILASPNLPTNTATSLQGVKTLLGSGPNLDVTKLFSAVGPALLNMGPLSNTQRSDLLNGLIKLVRNALGDVTDASVSNPLSGLLILLNLLTSVPAATVAQAVNSATNPNGPTDQTLKTALQAARDALSQILKTLQSTPSTVAGATQTANLVQVLLATILAALNVGGGEQVVLPSVCTILPNLQALKAADPKYATLVTNLLNALKDLLSKLGTTGSAPAVLTGVTQLLAGQPLPTTGPFQVTCALVSGTKPGPALAGLLPSILGQLAQLSGLMPQLPTTGALSDRLKLLETLLKLLSVVPPNAAGTPLGALGLLIPQILATAPSTDSCANDQLENILTTLAGLTGNSILQGNYGGSLLGILAPVLAALGGLPGTLTGLTSGLTGKLPVVNGLPGSDSSLLSGLPAQLTPLLSNLPISAPPALPTGVLDNITGLLGNNPTNGLTSNLLGNLLGGLLGGCVLGLLCG